MTIPCGGASEHCSDKGMDFHPTLISLSCDLTEAQVPLLFEGTASNFSDTVPSKANFAFMPYHSQD
jgi:hypothetical protein